MHKIFTFMFAALLSTQFAVAQRNLYVFDKSGGLNVYSALSFSFDDDIFSFTNHSVTEITKSSLSASFSVSFKSDSFQGLNQTPSVGVCFSDVNTAPTISDGRRSLGSSLTTYSFSLEGLDPGTTYYFRPYVKLNDAVLYGEVMEETTLGKKPTYVYVDGHKFVDLGLPSGLLWAETNIGAATAADDGDYFAWGETKSKSNYSWSTYAYGDDDDDLSKYNSTDGLVSLESSDDAATVNWGSSCRMPTESEFDELLNSSNCTWSWSTRIASDGSSISGYEVTSVSNGNTIFLPASGCRYGESLSYHGSNGYYWSSTRNSSDANNAYSLLFGSGYHRAGFNYRCCGHPVRPVAER